MDLVVEGRTITASGAQRVRLGIERGLFVAAGSRRPDVSFETGWMLPAAIDLHVHFRDPGHPDKEDLTSGTTSAAFGGVALACDMPNTRPATTSPALYDEKAGLVARKAVVDVGLWAGLAPGFEACKLGPRATGYKLYAGPTTGDLLVEDPNVWRQALSAVVRTGRPMAVHAEHPAILRDARARERQPADPLSHARLRPGEAEVEVLSILGREPRVPGARVHACHLSDPRSVAVCRKSGATSEVSPHHLLLDEGDVARLGAFAKVNPPIRHRAARDALWKGLAAGEIDCVASDHAPHTQEEKEAGFDEAPSGLPGVETLYPLMLAQAFAGALPIDRVIDACCTRPARVLGVPAGVLAPGAWASWVHVPEEARTIRAHDLHSRCGWTPFEGRAGVFPDTLSVRGRVVLERGELVGRPGEGRFVGGRAPWV